MSKFDLEIKDHTKNYLFKKHKQKYLVVREGTGVFLTKYEKELMKKKMKKLGIKSMSKFIRFCVMEQIKDLYDEEEVNKWQRLFDDYGDDFSDKSYRSVPY